MGDLWDYKLRRMELAWELAKRIIPEKPANSGRWSESEFLKHAEELIKKSEEIMAVTFPIPEQ